jgi:heptose-I-phosphate ethanolaminephosphotransferase
VRNEALERAQAAAPVVLREGPSTVVLVLTDSINRDNFSLYGYGRKTTPGLQQHQRQLGAQMQVLRNAWSVDAATLPAIGNLFAFGMPEADDAQHLLAMARVAGYKVWWISNHDDVAIEQQHARHADVLQMINREPGRSSMSLDGEMLDEFNTALQAPAQRKFIVVHMQGAHPHYSLRFPKGHNPFDDADDAVDAAMASRAARSGSGTAPELRRRAALPRLGGVRAAAPVARSGKAAGLYGLDVPVRPRAGSRPCRQPCGPQPRHGGGLPHTGHRVAVAHGGAHSGGLCPAALPGGLGGLDIGGPAGVQWHGQQAQRNVLHADYRWQAPHMPQLGTQITSFTD